MGKGGTLKVSWCMVWPGRCHATEALSLPPTDLGELPEPQDRLQIKTERKEGELGAKGHLRTNAESTAHPEPLPQGLCVAWSAMTDSFLASPSSRSPVHWAACRTRPSRLKPGSAVATPSGPLPLLGAKCCLGTFHIVGRKKKYHVRTQENHVKSRAACPRAVLRWSPAPLLHFRVPWIHT